MEVSPSTRRYLAQARTPIMTSTPAVQLPAVTATKTACCTEQDTHTHTLISKDNQQQGTKSSVKELAQESELICTDAYFCVLNRKRC